MLEVIRTAVFLGQLWELNCLFYPHSVLRRTRSIAVTSSAKKRSKRPKLPTDKPAKKPAMPGRPEWGKLIEKLKSASKRRSPESILGKQDFAECYRWGVAESQDQVISPWQSTLSFLAVSSVSGLSSPGKGKPLNNDEIDTEVVKFIGEVNLPTLTLDEAHQAVAWAASLPCLTQLLSEERWWELLTHLQQLRAGVVEHADVRAPVHLMIAGELALTLAWRCAAVPACQRYVKAAMVAIHEYLSQESDSIDRLLARPLEVRMLVASLIRCERIADQVFDRKIKKRDREIAGELATWMAALTRRDSTPVLSSLDRKSISSGVLQAAKAFDEESLKPAIDAALGKSHSGGRLAWEVSLPESMWHSEEGAVAAMLPEWDVRRGRTYLDYHGEDVFVEIMGGRAVVFQGKQQTVIRLDDVAQFPKGPWSCTCQYTDDDVHTIEIEQEYTGGVVLQRQWMLIRDDRCLMMSEAVLPKEKSDHQRLQDVVIESVMRLPIAGDIRASEETETREVFLDHKSKRRAMCVPLAANEWKAGMSLSKMSVSEDNHLVVTATGVGAVYNPLWIDFQTRRFSRKRTWRQLTIAENLETVPRSAAVAYRTQVGSEHWVVYRSLVDNAQDDVRTPRSFLGKHLIADFYAARFDPGDGVMEELVTIDGTGSDQSEID